MKTKVLELKNNQSLYVSIYSNKLKDYIQKKTGLHIAMTRWVPHCGLEKEKYPATFIRHGRPLNYEYCVLKVSTPYDKDTKFYILCKDVEMKKANSATPCIDLKSKQVVAVSMDKSKCLERYEEIVEASRDKSQSTQNDPNCHGSVLTHCNSSDCYGIYR